jgi:hypothetical protein
MLVSSFITSFQKGATSANIMSGFRSSGLCPVDPSEPLRSQYATPPPDPNILQTVSTGSEVGPTLLTCPDGLNFLRSIARLPPFPDGEHIISLPSIIEKIFQNTVEDGKGISEIPSYLEVSGPERYVRIKWKYRNLNSKM